MQTEADEWPIVCQVLHENELLCDRSNMLQAGILVTHLIFFFFLFYWLLNEVLNVCK